MGGAAQGVHLYEGIADAFGRIACGRDVGREDSLSIAQAQSGFRGFIVGGEIYAKVGMELCLAVDGIRKEFERAFVDGLLVVGAADMHADCVRREGGTTLVNALL